MLISRSADSVRGRCLAGREGGREEGWPLASCLRRRQRPTTEPLPPSFLLLKARPHPALGDLSHRPHQAKIHVQIAANFSGQVYIGKAVDKTELGLKGCRRQGFDPNQTDESLSYLNHNVCPTSTTVNLFRHFSPLYKKFASHQNPPLRTTGVTRNIIQFQTLEISIADIGRRKKQNATYEKKF